MASYHTSFTYKGISSAEKCLVIAAFDPQVGETSAFLNMEPMYEENIATGVRYDYGAKYNEVATINVTLVTFDGSDFTVDKFRDVARWLSGAKKASWLDLYENDKVAYSFLCKCTDVKQYKMDSRTIGVTATFTSNSPWAYSALQTETHEIDNTASEKSGTPIKIANMSDEGYAYTYPNITFKDSHSVIATFGVLADGTLYKSNNSPPVNEPIEWVEVDDTLIPESNYRYKADKNGGSIEVFSTKDFPITLDFGAVVRVKCSTGVGHSLSIYNHATNETTVVKNICLNEIITMTSNQVIYSSKTSRIFGDDFNFVWPKLMSGTNTISVSGKGTMTITYRYPIKVGDCVINLDANMSCGMCQEASQELASDIDVHDMFTNMYYTVFGGIA